MTFSSSSVTFAVSGAAETCIEASGVTRLFGKTTVLDNVSLAVKRGEIFGLLGPSGSGKTTLVRLLTGLDTPSGGRIALLGQPMPDLKLLSRIGYMAQSDALYGELTARENLAFFSSLYGLRGPALKARTAAVADLVKLSGHLDKTTAQFSGGMKRRLSLAVALMHEPEVLVLDEPTVGIDPVLRQSVWQELDQLRRGGVTILVTTHVMDEAEKCDRLAMIRDGRVTAIGSPAELKERSGSETMEEAFIAYSEGGGRS